MWQSRPFVSTKSALRESGPKEENWIDVNGIMACAASVQEKKV
jgi:hypothetical protein